MNPKAGGKSQNPSDFQELMTKLAPPTIPAQAVAAVPALSEPLKNLDRVSAASIVAGLQTVPGLQGNSCRLDWANRLVLSLCKGKRKVFRQHLQTLLNEHLTDARVAILEDPIEDFFVHPIGTHVGEFLVLSGIWESAAPHTENLLASFSMLRENPIKSRTLNEVVALLKISDAVLRRASLHRYQVGSGEPTCKVVLPDPSMLQSLAERVRFTWAELSDLGVDRTTLLPFTLKEDFSTNLLQTVPGDSILEFRPLLIDGVGVTLIAPQNITTAVRAHIVDVAVKGGQENSLQHNLLNEQSKMIRDSGFLSVAQAPAVKFGSSLAKQYVEARTLGHYQHIIQTTEGFEKFPEFAFSGRAVKNIELEQAITEAIKDARAFAQTQHDFIRGATFCFFGAWGRGLAFELAESEVQDDWPVIFLFSIDTIALGRCENGSFDDIWRLHRQLENVEKQGFNLTYANGSLNLFGWWRETDLALVPPHMIDIIPPTIINFPTDELLKVRCEGFLAVDRRVLLHPDGSYKQALRLDPKGYFENLEPIYGSTDSFGGPEVLGTTLACPCNIWLKANPSSASRRSEMSFETWRGVLNWMALILPKFWEKYGGAAVTKTLLIDLTIEWPEEDGYRVPEENPYSSIAFTVDLENATAAIVLRPEWQWALFRSDNRAEIALIATVLHVVSMLLNFSIPALELDQYVTRLVGPDIRWRHSLPILRVVDALKSRGMLKPFFPIPESAAALVKCGTVWDFRAREAGAVITGITECGTLLTEYSEFLLKRVILKIRVQNRKLLITASLSAIQSALADSRQWSQTSRAMRAIYGADDDFQGSLRRAMQINGVIRASSMLVEIASVESAIDGGIEVDNSSLSELQASVMMVFLNTDHASAIFGECASPKLRISPTGDVLSDHEFERLTLKSAAERSHKMGRRQSAGDYQRQFEKPETVEEPEADLLEAIEAEYNIAASVVLKLAAAAGDIAASEQTEILIMQQSEFIRRLNEFEAMRDEQLVALIARLTMTTRPSWDHLLSGWSRADIDVGKFDRRFSLIGRPIVALDNADDPNLAIAPAVIERSVAHSLSGAMTGSLQNEFWNSKTMRIYASRSGGRSGLKFNEELAEKLRAKGLRSWPSAKLSWCLNCKATVEVEAFGDVDVLGISEDCSRIWVIEAKDLKLCRTLGETARRMSDYRGHTDHKGRPDKLLRHLRRVGYLRDHADEIGKFFNLEMAPQISGIVVVSAPQPMESFQPHMSHDGRVFTLEDIEGVPWNSGWPT